MESATPSQLKLSYSATVVRALVFYCRTNELDDIRQPTNEEALRQVVKLSQCAIELELAGLETLVGNLVSSICQENVHLACTFFDEAASGGGKPPVDSVKSVALGFIRRNPEAALLRKNQIGNFYGGITSLQVESLKELMKDSRICTEEINLFRAIVVWSEAPCKQERPKNMDAWATQILIHNQREAAKPVVQECIDLSKIAPSDLLGTVTESGLVEETDVSNALIQIALRVETEGVHLSKRRSDDSRVIPRPLSPPSISYCTYDQPDSGVESVADILGDLTVDQTNASSYTYTPVEQTSNKRRASKQQPKLVTPPKRREPSFRTPERQQQPPPPMLPAGEAEDVASAKAAASAGAATGASLPPVKRKKRKAAVREKHSIGERIRIAVGMFLRDKVDTICIHPRNNTDGDSDEEDEVMVTPSQPPPSL